VARSGVGWTIGREQTGLRGVVSAVASGIMVVDDSGRVRFANPAACELFGRPLTELVGTEFGFPVVAGTAADVEVRAPDGSTRVVEMRVTTTFWNGEGVYVVSLREVTSLPQVEHELSAALMRVDVALGSHHELRARLSAILGFSSGLREEWDTVSEAEKLEFVERIEQNATSMERLLDQLLVVAPAHAGVAVTAPEAFDVAGLVATCIAAIGERAVDVRVACPPALLAYADPDHVREIVGNYLETALKYGEPPFQVFGIARDGFVEVRVCDCGPGVPEELLPTLFERFSREPEAAARAPGTGVALSLAASLARANGGEAWYEPHEPRGACFCVRVPGAPVGAPSTSAGTAGEGGGL
jgi:signal transduction histidine kinase